MSNPLPGDHAVTRQFTPSPAADHDVTVTPETGTPDSAPPPAVVPGFRLLRELGRGGMGVVYLATQDGLNRQVALKMVLSGDHASATEKGRFLAEAEAVAAVRHPGVVQVFDFGTHDGRPFFALEYLPGGSLTDRLKGTPLPAKEAAALVEQIAHAVQAAHAVGVIHRDLKPANILFDADGVPKVTDFGLARKGNSHSGLTATGAILGTPSYMAPEQAEGRKDVGPAADVYAVGAILYECLTGRPPFRAATPLETVHQVLKDEPVPPSRFSPKLPKDVETVCLKCLSKDPRKRYATAGAVADDLKRFLAGEPILARPVSLLEKYVRAVRRRPALNALIMLTCISVGVSIGVLTGSVKNLRRKQEQLEKEKAAVEAARQLAHARLEKAVEAVDRMMTRVNGERWATDPALQGERRRMLEDAVAFFDGFTAEDSADPLVRKEAAKAHTRMSGAYLMLSDLGKAAAANREAIRLYDGLMADYPDAPEYKAAASEVYSMRGATAALSADYADAVTALSRAVELADAARRLDPTSPVCKLRAVEARASLGYFYLQADRAKGEALLGPMLELGRELNAAADAPYEHRVSLAFALTVAAAYDLSGGKLPAALGRYAEAGKLLDRVADQTAPSARVWDQFAHTRAMVAAQTGFIRCLLATSDDERRAGAERLRVGLAEFDALLRVNPKAFPYRLQKFQVLRALAEVSRRLKDTAAAAEADAAADRLIEAMIADNPHLHWVRAIDALRRTQVLVDRVRAGEREAIEAAEKLRADIDPAERGDAFYNLACVYAVAAAKHPADAEKYAAKAVAALNDLNATAYFRTPGRVAHLDKDADLDSLRQRDDFKAFRAAAGKLPADKPPVR